MAVGVDGAETNKTLAINNNVSNKETPSCQKHITGFVKFYIALPIVTVCGLTAGLGRCLERACTVIT